MTGHYDEALICENGHLITSGARGDPGSTAKFCVRCGKPILGKCLKCEAPIRGRYIGTYYKGDGWDAKPVNRVARMRFIPNHCHECGEPYPWTKANAEALAALIDTLNELEPEEREQLRRSIPDIMADTPRSNVATVWLKRAFVKVGDEARNLLVDVLSKVATDAVKKNLGV